MSFVVTLLPGDGIGPEVTAAAREVLSLAAKRADLPLVTREALIGGAAIDETGEPLPGETLELCRASHGVLLGAVGGPKWEEAPKRPEAGLLAIREAMGLYANLRPVRIIPGLEHHSPLRDAGGTDILIVRELTGGLYFGDRKEGDESASDVCSYSAAEIDRVLHRAFGAARARKGRLVSVDKANVLATSRLWRRRVGVVAGSYPDVEVRHVLVDAMAMHLLTRPQGFDVVVTENLFGDILSDEAAALSGTLGLAASASLGDEGKPGLYEPIHGSAPDIAGKGLANPAGAILSTALLLRHGAGEETAAQAIENAVDRVVRGGILTPDLGGEHGTESFAEAVLEAM